MARNSIVSRVLPLALTPLALTWVALLGSGCASSFKIKDPPPGYIEVSDYDNWNHARQVHMKAPDNVGLNIRTFENYQGGTLPLWSQDLVKKLGQRGYTLTGQKAIESANGVAGTRFDFRYTPPGLEPPEEKFYTALLFVSDEWIVIAQFAGKTELASAHEKDIDALLKQLKVRGCKVGEKTCDGPQPDKLSTPSQSPLSGDVGKPSGDDVEPMENPPEGTNPSVEAPPPS